MFVFLVILFGVVLVLALQWLGPGRRSDVSGCKEGVPKSRQTVSDGLQDIDRAATLRKRLRLSQWETARDRHYISRSVGGSLAVKPIRKAVRKGKQSP